MSEQVRTCVVCEKPAVVLDTEYDEAYCAKHAQEYQVYAGPHRDLVEG